jgi:hypothetical protein
MFEENEWGAPCLADFARHGNHGSWDLELPRSRNNSETWGTPFRDFNRVNLMKCSFVTDS